MGGEGGGDEEWGWMRGGGEEVAHVHFSSSSIK